MYRDHHYASPASSGPPPQPPPPGVYDRYETYPPPPPPSDLPPPPPPPPSQQWDPRPPPTRRDSHFSRDRSGDHRFRGPYSDLRQPRGSYNRDNRDNRDTRDNRDNRDNRDSRDNRDYRDDYRPPRGEFTFRQEAPAGIDSYRPPAYSNHGDRNDNYAPRRHDSRRTRGGQHPNQSRRTGPYVRQPKEKAVDRLLLSKRFDETSELMLGDTAIRASYRDVDELSESDEMDMDISDNDESDSNAAERPTKRARTNNSATTTTTTTATMAAHDQPKWSNPDPYTVLPPPETTRKKDVVQLIRKARVEAEAKKPTISTEAADFISCDFSDEESTNQVQNGAGRAAAIVQPDAGNRVANAPTGPRAASSTITLPSKPPVSTHNHTSQNQHPDKVQTTQPQLQPQLQPQPQPSKLTKPGSKSAPIDLTASASLGNRKRTIDDEIKLPHAPLKKVNRMASGGGIVPIWRPEPREEDPCPWAIIDHSATPNAGTRLHKEIIDFYDYVRPRDFEEKVRRELVSKLETLVRRKWHDARILPFGSFMSGLYLPTADMDIAICSQGFIDGKFPVYDKKKYLFHMKYYLETQKVAFRNEVEAISRAKVPLLKYTDDYTGLKVDISFEKIDGQKAIRTFLKWKKQYPAMPPLVALIKHFLLMRGLNEPVNGGIGGFSAICMVVHLLQMMPEVQSGSMKAEEHLGEVFMKFLKYYGQEFNYEKVAIRMDPPGIVNKAKASSLVYRNLDRLSIIDPNSPENDISGGSSNYWVVKECFAKAYDILQKTMMHSSSEPASTTSNSTKNILLGPLFAGKYSHFEIQRKWLDKLDKEGLPEYGQPDSARGTAKGSQWDDVEW